MKRFLPCLLLILLTACAPFTAEPEVANPEIAPTDAPEWQREGWELVWHDEFEEAILDPASWTFDLGAGGWGNNEWQFYTDRPENVRLENGLLVIEARKESYRASDYTSARIKTQGLETWTYGRIEASMKLPTGQGVWSAFWMLGEDILSVGWPNSGEIDILENIGEISTIYGTVHGPGYSGGEGVGAAYSTSFILNESFHTYAIEWNPEQINWYLDDTLFSTVYASEVPGPWVYDHPFFIILNLAIGGTWPGYPDETTVFPQQLQVDYVRVYRDPDLDLESLEPVKIHVAEIKMDLEYIDENWQGSVYVTVVDEDGVAVENVLVDAGWLGVIAGADLSSVTDENGIAGPFLGRQAPASDEISFCVTSLALVLYRYDKDSNVMTCLFVDPDTAPTP